jgi:hypothetical protein
MVDKHMIALSLSILMLAACGASHDVSPTWPVSPTNTPPATQPVLNHNPLDTEPCMAPCWQNITPGETTLDQAAQILGDRGDLGGCPAINGYIKCDWVVIHAGDNGIVEVIKMGPSETVTLADAIALYGEPDEVHFCTSYEEYENPQHTISVSYFASYRLWLTFVEPGEPIVPVHPGMVVREMIYGLTGLDVTWMNCDNHYQESEWLGYGDYNE